MEVTKEQIEFYLNKITSDKLFVRAFRYSQLLQFLVAQMVEGNDVKEYAIGQHIFGDQYDTNLNDGKARVYVYNLRKKLSEYYQHRGLNDKFRFSIKSGSYNLTIEENIEEEERSALEGKQKIGVKYIAAILLLLVVIVGVISKIAVTSQNLYCWDKFMVKGSKNLCIMADQVMLRHIIGGYKASTTHPLANNLDDYNELKKRISGDSLNRSLYTLLTKGVPYALYDISKWFFANDSEFDMILETQVLYSNIRNNNIIYIGQYKMMGTTKSIFLKDSKMFSAGRDKFIVKSGEEERVYKTNYDNSHLVVDYGVVSYAPLADGCDAIFFVSNHDVGTMAPVAQFTDPQSLKRLYKEYDLEGKYFNALFQVKGIDRNDVNCELIELEILP